MSLLSVIVPCYNEERNIYEFYTKVLEQITKIQTLNPSVACEFVFIDDGSSDKTLRILEELSRVDVRVKFLSFSRNFGKICDFSRIKGERRRLYSAYRCRFTASCGAYFYHV